MEAAGPQATAVPAGEPQAGAEEIDMSLGPKGFRRGFGQQQFSRRQFRNAMPRPRRKAAAAFSGVSPLNRQVSAQEDRNTDAFAKSSSSGQPEGRRRPPLGPKRFGAAAASTQASGRRGPGFQQKRMQQRFNKANFQRGQMDANGQAKPVRLRRWKVKPSPAAVLTVSVANPQAGQSGTPGYQRPFLRSQRPPPRLAKPQPKGVLLRFNFRAMANQTSLTLDERFSGLRNRRRFPAARSSGRTVTMA
ncbi:UAP56-interacting factor-like isoform X4 [Melanerpes formicivorus]|uniref:UAP56-interacting factor-like isoform X4 n=1 Tax=Melanerpes formicivorus TaxID=211600 RepID=UPI00358E14B0